MDGCINLAVIPLYTEYFPAVQVSLNGRSLLNILLNRLVLAGSLHGIYLVAPHNEPRIREIEREIAKVKLQAGKPIGLYVGDYNYVVRIGQFLESSFVEDPARTVVVRISPDSTFVDWRYVDELLYLFQASDYRIAIPRYYPDGSVPQELFLGTELLEQLRQCSPQQVVDAWRNPYSREEGAFGYLRNPRVSSDSLNLKILSQTSYGEPFIRGEIFSAAKRLLEGPFNRFLDAGVEEIISVLDTIKKHEASWIQFLSLLWNGPVIRLEVCPHCGSKEKKEIYPRLDYVMPFLLRSAPLYVKCSACDLVYLQYMPVNPGDYYDSSYAEKLCGNCNHPWYERAIDLIKKLCRPQGRLLDVGGGTGNFAELVKEKCPGWEVTVLDIAADSLRVCRSRGFRTIEAAFTELPVGETGYDVVTMFEVVEHLPFDQFRNYCQRAYQVLAEEGLFILTTPNGNSFFHQAYGLNLVSGPNNAHLMLLSPSMIRKVFLASGFRKVELSTYAVPFFPHRQLLNADRGLEVFTDEIIGLYFKDPHAYNGWEKSGCVRNMDGGIAAVGYK